MEKLLELLNEYDPYIQKDGELRDNSWYFVYKGGSAIFPKEIGMLKIISKEYGFIEWLAENEKIDYNKDKYGMIFFENGSQVFLTSADEVIMELSIQDEPIEFLVSILKNV